MKRIVKYFIPKEKKQEVFNAFVTEMVKINANHPNINYGGCGFFAILLYDKLKALGVNPKIAVMVYSKDCFLESQKMYFEYGFEYYQNHRGEGFPHVIVTLDGFYIDSSGAYTDYTSMPSYRNYFTLVRGVNVDFVRYCSEQPEIWNDEFNRNEIPVIEKKIEKIKKKVLTKTLVDSI